MRAGLAVSLALLIAAGANAQEVGRFVAEHRVNPVLGEGDTRLVYMPENWREVIKVAVSYAENKQCNIYLPPDASRARPVVVIANGYMRRDEEGIQAADGALYKDLGLVASWAVALSARGFVAVTYDSFDRDKKRDEKEEPPQSTIDLFRYLEHNKESLGIDERRVGVLALGPTALRFQLNVQKQERWNKYIKGIAYNWPILDSTVKMRTDSRVLIVRSGKLNSSMLFEIDNYAEALKKDKKRVYVHDNPSGGYNYDTVVRNEESRMAIEEILKFFEACL